MADTLRDVDTISQYLGLTHDAPYPEDRQRAREALGRLAADAARVGKMREALEWIAANDHSQVCSQTITGTKIIKRIGRFARAARAALKDHSR